jgi:hypothetical protein
MKDRSQLNLKIKKFALFLARNKKAGKKFTSLFILGRLFVFHGLNLLNLSP